MTTLNNTYINALLADASYVCLQEGDNDSPVGKPLKSTSEQLKALTPSLTEPQAKYVIDNFEVLNQELSPVKQF